MAVLVPIVTTYNGAGAKRALRDLTVLQKHAALAGNKSAAGLYAASAAWQKHGAAIATTGAMLSKRFTVPILGMGAAAVYSTQQVEKGLNKVRAGTGATGAKLAGLEQSFRNVAKTSGRDFETIGETVARVNQRLGLTGRPLEQVTSKFLTLSRVTKTDVGPLMEEVTRAMNDAGIKTGDTAAFLDKLLVASQKTGAGVAGLASDMYRYGSPLRQLGFGMDETIATLASFDKAGVNTKLVMGSMRIALGKMAATGEKDLPNALSKGITAIKNAKTGGDAARKAIELFGARAGPDMAAAIREGRFEVDTLVKQLQGSEGAVDRTGKATLTLAGKMAKLKNQAMLVGDGFGTMLIPHLEKLVDIGAGVVRWLEGLDAGWRNVILKTGMFVAAVGPVLVVTGKIAGGIGRVYGAAANLTLAFGKGASTAPLWARAVAGASKGAASLVKTGVQAAVAIGRQAAAFLVDAGAKAASTAATIAHSVATKASAAAQWLLNAAMSANPIGLVVVAIGALVAGLVVAYKRSETFRNIVNAAWAAVKKGAVAVFGFLTAYFRNWVAGVRLAFSGLKAIVAAAVGFFQRLREGASRALSAVVDFAKSLPGRIVRAITAPQRILYSIGGDIVRGLVRGLTDAWHWVTDKLKSLVGSLSKAAKKVLGIGSPSKVFALMGRQTAEGLVLGMRRSEDQVREAARRLVGAAAPGFSAPIGTPAFAGAGGSGNVLNVGAISLSFGGGDGGPSPADVEAVVYRALRRVVAEMQRS